jgi:ribose transport system substrate-binding protein
MMATQTLIANSRWLRATRSALLLLLLWLMIGCGESPTDSPRGEVQTKINGPFTIAVLPRAASEHDARLMRAGMAKAAAGLAERGVEVRIDWQSPVPEGRPEAQARRLRDVIGQQVDGLALAPQHEDRLNQAIAEAVAAGVPVVLVGSSASTDDATGFIGSDNEKLGRMAGRYLATLLDESGHLAIVSYLPGSTGTAARQAGFADAAEAHTQLQLTQAPPPADGTVDSAHDAASAFLDVFYAQHGAMPDGLFCPNEPTTLGTLEALRDRGLAGRVPLVGVGSSGELVEALADDQIDALLVEDPMAMGSAALRTIVARLQGRSFEPRVVTEVVLVTPESMSYGSVADRLSQDPKDSLNEPRP